MPRSPKSIFFDVGNTLLFPSRRRILAPLHARNVVPTEEHLQALEQRTKKEFDAMMQGKLHADHSFWFIFYSHLLDDLGIDDENLRNALVEATRISANWDVIKPATCEALQKIARCYRIGVISNADGKIAGILQHCGIYGCFMSITDSGIVGKEKPHPAIFEAALKSLGVKANESLYVGDVYSIDYLGATGVGMQAVLLDVSGAYRSHGEPSVQSLDELELLLETLAWK